MTSDKAAFIFALIISFQYLAFSQNAKGKEMAEIIDILNLKITESPNFVVNTAINSVSLNNCGTQFIFRNASNKRWFHQGDNIIILSVGFYLPESFVMAQRPAAGLNRALFEFTLGSDDTSLANYRPADAFGGSGNIFIPFPNYEMSIGTYIDAELYLQADDYVLIGTFGNNANPIEISMINVPAALNGDTIYLTPWIKVLHNKPMF